MADAAAVRFLDAATGALLAELDGPFLPEAPLPVGARLRRSQTHYKGARQQSAQVLGVEEEPIPFEGRLDDTFSGGAAGRAKTYAEALDRTFRAARQVTLEWGDLRRTGLLDECHIDHEDETAFEYRLVFWPDSGPGVKVAPWVPRLWRDQALNPAVLLNDTADARSILDQFRSARDRLMGAWQALNPMRLELLQIVYGVENTLGDLVNAANLPFDVVAASLDLRQRILRIGTAAQTGWANLAARARALDATPAVDDETLDSIRDSVVLRETAGKARLSQSRILEMIRSFLAATDGEATGRKHEVIQGDSLPGISLLYYQTADKWRRIADANGLTTMRLTPGQRLRVPE
jgi:hypothetical protein